MDWLAAILDWFHFVQERLPELWLRTGQHVLLTGASTLRLLPLGAETPSRQDVG